jgi:3-oxoacyl-[acyl-carrier-protein] synthase II
MTAAPRIVVTGLGVVTSLGRQLPEFWRRLLAGTSGISPVASFDTGKYRVHLGGEVKGFDASGLVERLDPRATGRASLLAAVAARAAVADAGLFTGPAAPPRERVGVVMGTTSGEPLEVERLNDLWVADRLGELGPTFMERYPNHVIAGQVARELDLGGPNVMLPTACAAGNYAIAHAFDALLMGRAEAMLAGGADAFSRITYTGFARLGAIAPERCQPFDRNRQGMIPGEGAAVLVLETEAGVRRRGAAVYAEVAGYGLSCDAHHMTAAHPEGEGAARAMEAALEAAGLAPEAVDYVSAHGTGTPSNDRMESQALRRVFGERTPRVPVSSVKSMLGHTMGAASAIEAVVCSLAVRDGVVPPTLHYEEPDPECELDVVPHQARALPVTVAMNNAYAFGGNNASVLFRRWP